MSTTKKTQPWTHERHSAAIVDDVLDGNAKRDALAEIERLQAEVRYYKDREQSIITACERVADGGQYRADIVGAIERIRRQRDERGGLLRQFVSACDGNPHTRSIVAAALEALK